MKDKLTVPFLKHQLRQATWLPLSLTIAVLLCVVAYVLQGQEREKIKAIHEALSDLVSSQQTYFSQEIYLNQAEALNRRIEDLLSLWRQKFPSVKACLRLEHSGGRVNLIERCSTDEAGKAPKDSPAYFADTRIRVGEQVLATLRFAVIRRASFFDLFPPVLLLTIFVGLLGTALAHRSLVARIESRLLNPLLLKMREDQKNAAVAEA